MLKILDIILLYIIDYMRARVWDDKNKKDNKDNYTPDGEDNKDN